MLHHYTTRYEDILLKPMTIDDSEKYRRLRNQDEIRKWFENTGVISMEAQARWFESYLHKEDEMMFSIYNSHDDFIGGCSLYKIGGGTSEYGRLIVAPEYRGKGYGRISTIAALDVAKALGLHTVHLDVFADNQSAIRTYIAAGFEDTGHRLMVRNKEMISMEVRLERN